MSQKTDTTIAAAPCCGSCVQMREEDGYCKHLGRYVNYFRIACKDYVDRIAVAERPGPDSSDAKEMKAPDKIYVEVCEEAIFAFPQPPFEESIEYIHKDALLEWAKETYLNENASAIRKVCYKQLIDKIESL